MAEKMVFPSHDGAADPAAKFTIPDEVQAKWPELVKLVLETESMDDNEKQYWFDILPSMKAEQVDRLFNILQTEKDKLAELEKKYQEEIKTLNEKHLIEWQELQLKATKEKIKSETDDRMVEAQVEGIFMDLRDADAQIGFPNHKA